MAIQQEQFSQEDRVIETFNQLFSQIPSNKSFDMTLKVYLQEWADVNEQKPPLIAPNMKKSKSSSSQVIPTCIVNYGHVTSSSSTSLSSSGSSSNNRRKPKSTTNVSKKTSSSTDIGLKKDRTMMTLFDASNAVGEKVHKYAQRSTSSGTVYENVTRSESQSSNGTSTRDSYLPTKSSFVAYPCEDGWTTIPSKPVERSTDLKIQFDHIF